MSLELIYTSVPQGLKPGSKGFCTVAMTSGMPAALVERLESLSGYRPVFELGDPSADHNPVSWAHWRISVGGKMRSILSRVCFAGVDYSQRSNKLAHHLVLNAAEEAAAGPAWLMSQPGIMQTQWNRAPQLLPDGRAIPLGDRPPRPCRAWESLVGDAGLAGVLAGSFASEPAKPAYLIYQPGTDILPLLEEAIALLPVALRWQLTFSTYFTELPLNLSCAWRGVIVGSPAAKAAQRATGRSLVLDLTNAGGLVPEGEFAEAARKGAYVVTARPTQTVSRTVKTSAMEDALDPETIPFQDRDVESESRVPKRPTGPLRSRFQRLPDPAKPDLFDLVEEPLASVGSQGGIYRHVEKSAMPGRRTKLGPIIAVAISSCVAGIIIGFCVASSLHSSGLNVSAALTAPVVTANPPTKQSATVGQSVSFTADASGNPAPSVKWQESDGGGPFKDITGNTTANTKTLTLPTVPQTLNGSQYQAVFTNTVSSAISNSTTLNVSAALTAPVVTANPPTKQSATVGQSVSFTADASGNPAPSVKWQESDGGGPFKDITGNTTANTKTLTLPTVPQTLNGSQYQAVFTNSVKSVVSNPITLTVSLTPPPSSTLPATNTPTQRVNEHPTIKQIEPAPMARVSQQLRFENYQSCMSADAFSVADPSKGASIATIGQVADSDSIRVVLPDEKPSFDYGTVEANISEGERDAVITLKSKSPVGAIPRPPHIATISIQPSGSLSWKTDRDEATNADLLKVLRYVCIVVLRNDRPIRAVPGMLSPKNTAAGLLDGVFTIPLDWKWDVNPPITYQLNMPPSETGWKLSPDGADWKATCEYGVVKFTFALSNPSTATIRSPDLGDLRKTKNEDRKTALEELSKPDNRPNSTTPWPGTNMEPEKRVESWKKKLDELNADLTALQKKEHPSQDDTAQQTRLKQFLGKAGEKWSAANTANKAVTAIDHFPQLHFIAKLLNGIVIGDSSLGFGDNPK